MHHLTKFVTFYEKAPSGGARGSAAVQVACLGHGLELIEIQLRDYFLKLAAETGIWHGILPLNEEEITYYNQAIRLGYLEPPPEDEDDVEAWQNDQDAIIYTYFRGLPEVMRIANDEPLTINPATWVDLDCKLGEARTLLRCLLVFLEAIPFSAIYRIFIVAAAVLNAARYLL